MKTIADIKSSTPEKVLEYIQQQDELIAKLRDQLLNLLQTLRADPLNPTIQQAFDTMVANQETILANAIQAQQGDFMDFDKYVKERRERNNNVQISTN